jgi:transcriptional regulator with XRE-family HTH domain
MNALCAEKGITVNGLCIRAGVTQSTVHGIVTGRTYSPGIVTIQRLCDGLDITIREFFDDSLFDHLDQAIQ